MTNDNARWPLSAFVSSTELATIGVPLGSSRVPMWSRWKATRLACVVLGTADACSMPVQAQDQCSLCLERGRGMDWTIEEDAFHKVFQWAALEMNTKAIIL